MKKRLIFLVLIIALICSSCVKREKSTDIENVSEFAIDTTELSKYNEFSNGEIIKHVKINEEWGAGVLYYVKPSESDKDYVLCFAKLTENDENDNALGKNALNLNPDYVFPDVRLENASIGEFENIIFCEFLQTDDGREEIIVIATYVEEEKKVYDTRVYAKEHMDESLEYVADTDKIDYFNKKYYEVRKDYLKAVQMDKKYNSWYDAYRCILENLLQYHIGPYKLPEYCYFDPENIDIYIVLHDFEEDGIPELLVGDELGITVFTYKDGKIKKLVEMLPLEEWYAYNCFMIKENMFLMQTAGTEGCGYTNLKYENGTYYLGRYCDYHYEETEINGKTVSPEEYLNLFDMDDSGYKRIEKVKFNIYTGNIYYDDLSSGNNGYKELRVDDELDLKNFEQ